MATNSVNEKQLLINDLLESVKQCQIRFGGRPELATDFDQRVIKLCESLEKALTHGLRSDKKLIHFQRKAVANGMTRSSSAGQGWSDSHESNVCFWHFVSLLLGRHELDRYLLLRNVRTDSGRGKAWLRSALNEHSLERYVLTLLSDSSDLRNQFYEENALIRDEDITSILPTISRGLNSILFAINIDNSEFDVFFNNSKAIDINSRSDPLPVVCKSSPSDSTTGVRKRRTRVNVISLSDDDDQSEASILARSAPTTSLSSPDSVFRTKNFGAIYENMSSSEVSKTETKSELYAIESINSDVVLTPLLTDNTSNLELMVDLNSDSDKLSVTDNNLEANKFELSGESNPDKEELERMKTQIIVLKNKFEERVSKLETQNESLQKDNNLLQIQLKKYIAAIQLLRYSNKSDNSSNQWPDNSDNEDSVSQTLVEMQNQSFSYEVNEYERKLVEVAQMHAELVEFNTHLHRVIRQKDALISRLKDQLIDLRGPLPEATEATEDLMSISSDFETDLSIQSSISHPLIHIWIPTVFLAGGQKNKSHHIYQIYVRIRDDEWNVYRRYSQFHSLHKTLRKKFQILSTFDFPPKKTIGNKDSKVVQERRKKLEHYLRNLINLLQSQHHIPDKQRLIDVLPFLSERFIQNDGRSRSDTQLNFTNSSDQNQRPEPHYMGL